MHGDEARASKVLETSPLFEVANHQPVLDQRFATRPAWRTADVWSTESNCQACVCATGAQTIGTWSRAAGAAER